MSMHKETKKTNAVLNLLKDFRFNSILVRNFLVVFFVLISIFFSIMLIIRNKLDQFASGQVETISRMTLQLYAEQLDSIIEESAYISSQLSIDENIMNFLLADTSTENVYRPEALKAKQTLNNYAHIFPYIDSIYVYSGNSRFIVTDKGGESLSSFRDMTWYSVMNENRGSASRIVNRLKNGKYPYILTYIYSVKLTQQQSLGGIIINIDTDQILRPLENDSESIVFMVNGDDDILYSTEKSHVGQKWSEMPFLDLKEGQFMFSSSEFESSRVSLFEDQYTLTGIDSRSFDVSYYIMVPMAQYQGYRATLMSFIYGMSVVILILSLLCTLLISIISYEPIASIIGLMKDPTQYDPQISTGLGHNELDEISQNILRNFYSNNELRNDLQEYLAITNRAQVAALQAQISPHFLYNTLENIRWKAMDAMNGDNEVSEMILNLAELLRISLDTQESVISLKEEIENAKVYIKIMQLRYENKLCVSWQTDESLLDCQVVKVSLQPLIENAIRHGIKPMKGQGRVDIQCWKSGDDICIKISDNGVGMSQEKCEELNREMQEKYLLKEEHIGVGNVNQRLKLLLGERAGLSFSSVPNGGTSVIMTIPYMKITVKGETA